MLICVAADRAKYHLLRGCQATAAQLGVRHRPSTPLATEPLFLRLRNIPKLDDSAHLAPCPSGAAHRPPHFDSLNRCFASNVAVGTGGGGGVRTRGASCTARPVRNTLAVGTAMTVRTAVAVAVSVDVAIRAVRRRDLTILSREQPITRLLTRTLQHPLQSCGPCAWWPQPPLLQPLGRLALIAGRRHVLRQHHTAISMPYAPVAQYSVRHHEHTTVVFWQVVTVYGISSSIHLIVATSAIGYCAVIVRTACCCRVVPTTDHSREHGG